MIFVLIFLNTNSTHMKKIYLLVSITILIFACQKETKNFTLKGQIKGLKKGTVYLQKQRDSALITIDSIAINGNSQFELHANLDEPEVLFIKLDKNDNDTNLISFFADKGITEINTSIKNFIFDTTIKGSKQQTALSEYREMMSKYTNKNLDLIKQSFEAQKDKNSSKSDSITNVYNRYLKSKYLYTVNFALKNKDNEIAPYLAITEINNINIKYLDTINNMLPTEIKMSKYGKELQELIDKRKEN